MCITGAVGSYTSGVVVDNNQVLNNVWRSGWAGSRAGNDDDPIGIIVYTNTGTTCSYGTQVTNNTITGTFGAGIEIYQNEQSIITGNTISGTISAGGDADGSGVILFASSNTTVTGNTITGNAGGGVWYVGPGSSPSSNTLSPNTFSGNGGANYPKFHRPIARVPLFHMAIRWIPGFRY
jgi:parallel beta-helix repeat protein